MVKLASHRFWAFGGICRGWNLGRPKLPDLQLNQRRRSPTNSLHGKRQFPMKRIVVPVLVALVVVVAATMVLQSQPAGKDIAVEASAMMPIREMHAKIDLTKLPVDAFEDQSLIFPAAAKH
jgi:hypothetical protein